jgi:hypothetical protein
MEERVLKSQLIEQLYSTDGKKIWKSSLSEAVRGRRVVHFPFLVLNLIMGGLNLTDFWKQCDSCVWAEILKFMFGGMHALEQKICVPTQRLLWVRGKITESPDLVWPDYFQPAVRLNSEIHLNRIYKLISIVTVRFVSITKTDRLISFIAIISVYFKSNNGHKSWLTMCHIRFHDNYCAWTFS